MCKHASLHAYFRIEGGRGEKGVLHSSQERPARRRQVREKGNVVAGRGYGGEGTGGYIVRSLARSSMGGKRRDEVETGGETKREEGFDK